MKLISILNMAHIMELVHLVKTARDVIGILVSRLIRMPKMPHVLWFRLIISCTTYLRLVLAIP